MPNDFSLLRMCSLGLVEATRGDTPAQVVQATLAMQGQQVSALPHAITARLRSGGGASVWQAFAEQQILRSWPMRGTVHISTREDHHWLRAALAHRYGPSRFTDAELARSAEVAGEVIARTGGATRAQLRRAWEEDGLIDPDSEEAQARRRAFLLRLHIEGRAVGAQQVGGEHLIVDASGLPDADSSPAGVGVAFGQPNHEVALAQIAARYAWGHGPVSVADLARWTGLSLSVSARALLAAVEASASSGGGSAPTFVPGPLVWVRALYEGEAEVGVEVCEPLLARPGGVSMPGYYVMRADLLDILSANRQEAEALHYLPSFDELHVGFKNRLSLTDAAGEKLICPTNNGLFRPLCVEGGRVIAVNPVNKGLLWADGVRVTEALEARVREAIEVARLRVAE
ncbi:crosslink repair DNA glycosylase YcaQ family protein [Schaalia sp. Marseille-Q2122]|uniref:DNA glycosylase AlkZ-like family protein n=1 Tax=Schaalia sp. Marseille-Q2122 TaxID=2736604 RepID=UPI00158CC9F2|nr:crosslink repair DNA glycosylase YcaQ family protein [Schaalia sp. Marseille-Q2122]